jgi:hypothetical protein
VNEILSSKLGCRGLVMHLYGKISKQLALTVANFSLREGDFPLKCLVSGAASMPAIFDSDIEENELIDASTRE